MKAISSLGVRSPLVGMPYLLQYETNSNARGRPSLGGEGKKQTP